MAYEPEVDDDLKLRDGRTLAYCQWGDRAGRPIFLFHGAPGSRLFAPDSMTTAEAGVRLITVDRPGYGRSDPRPGRQILDWPADVQEVADTLGVEEFGVAGHSSGGPYALACALALPERVDRVALVSCIGPYDLPTAGQVDDDDLTVRARQDLGRAAAEVAESASWLMDTPELFADLPRPEPDLVLLANPAIRAMFVHTIREAVKQGMDAYGWECAVERRPWGFALDEIGAPVWIFQGEQDRAVPTSQARALAASLPGSRLRLFPDAAHGLILSEWSVILGDLQSEPGGPASAGGAR
ncbi:MAG: alpha/beta hydrolase [Friedmanniella sp.]|nr:alpha/beta hydrolase [Friedmanniella sp.]